MSVRRGKLSETQIQEFYMQGHSTGKKDFRVDCIISAGELDEGGYRFKDNDLRVLEVAKRNVPYSEFESWLDSAKTSKRRLELERIGRERVGMKYEVNLFCTTASEDKDAK